MSDKRMGDGGRLRPDSLAGTSLDPDLLRESFRGRILPKPIDPPPDPPPPPLDLGQQIVMESALGRKIVEAGRKRAMKGYPEFLDDMGKILTASLPRTDRERDELFAAEAEVRRLRSQLAVAEERRDLARTRYARERDLLMEVFGTWKAEVMALPTEAATATAANVPDHPEREPEHE